MTEDGNAVLVDVVDERQFRIERLAGHFNTIAGVATDEERRYYYHMSKKGMGFSPEDRRRIWL